MFAGISTVLFAAVCNYSVYLRFIFDLYKLDGISKDKQFVGFANYILSAESA